MSTMLSQISWNTYIETLLLLLTGYYLVIGYLFYRHELSQLIPGAKITHGVHAATHMPTPLVRAFVDEVGVFMNDAAKNSAVKNEIVQSLQLLLKKYPYLKEPVYRQTVQNLIYNECASYCSIDLSDEELSELWV